MTGSQLNKWRIDHSLTLRDVAEKNLGGDVTHSTISRWESEENGTKAIPQWASDKLLGQTQITLPLDDLHQLLDYGREHNIPSHELMAQAIREWLTKQRKKKAPGFQEGEISAAGKKLKLYSPGAESPDSKVAEDPPA